jgi:tetratricopeptide (TPR) repeat protein
MIAALQAKFPFGHPSTRPQSCPWGRCRWLVVSFSLVSILAVAVASGAADRQAPSSQQVFRKLTPDDAATRDGFFHFYNMEYAPAIADFEKSVAAHPGDPYPLNHLLEAVLFQELHREGKLDAELYLSNEFVHENETAPDAAAIAHVGELMQQVFEIENAQLAANPDNVSALYARSVTRGLHATEQALVDRAWFAALRSGLGAYNDSKHVLELQPADSDAKLVVGIYNYVVGSLPWPVKIAAFLASLHGSKSKGLALIREAADGGGEASVDARTTLALFLAREHQYPEALQLTGWLYSAFPQNFIYGISEADLLKSAGQRVEAIQAYRRLIDLGRQGQFAGENVGVAAVDLGSLLRTEHDWRGAAEAYESVSTLPHPEPELVLRARLAAGQMYDRSGQRPLAVRCYQQVIDANSDAQATEEAQRWLKQPYRGD